MRPKRSVTARSWGRDVKPEGWKDVCLFIANIYLSVFFLASHLVLTNTFEKYLARQEQLEDVPELSQVKFSYGGC